MNNISRRNYIFSIWGSPANGIDLLVGEPESHKYPLVTWQFDSGSRMDTAKQVRSNMNGCIFDESYDLVSLL